MTRQVSTATCLALSIVVTLFAFAQGKLVELDFYGEALCPYCANFTKIHLAELFSSGLSELVDFKFIPYGNAKYDKNTSTITCQHKQIECEYNKLIGCAIDAYADQDDWFPFFECVEHFVFNETDIKKVATVCADKADLDFSDIYDCYEGPKGDELQTRARKATEDLVPRKEWVPWVVVNGIPLRDDYRLVVQFVCAAFPGKKPKKCYEPALPEATLLRGQNVHSSDISLAPKVSRDSRFSSAA